MYNAVAKSRVAPEKSEPYRPDFALKVVRFNAEGVFMKDKKLCRVEGCNIPRNGAHTLCGNHRYKWEKYKSLEKPEKITEIIPDGFVQICNHHGLLKKEEVYRFHGVPGKVYLKCKKCTNERTRKWEKNNPEKVKRNKHRSYYKNAKYSSVREIVLKKKISLEMYNKMFEEQKDLCYLCGNPEIRKRKDGTISPLCVDHCHKTGKVRNLLCFRCNAGIGFLNENPNLLLKASSYITEWSHKHSKDEE